ncbi:hypothetical protein [Asanoa siamensis]|uniref:Lipoprotein n=1 Tax=Asanoa siamensis TaxID=926357 RepID=A0ABQ4CJD6_9ACTN|nr:hypothetical protein [Asanoa siamensis]GIF71394.1 hypothetical protein Asi02nite_09120 [Asanoa siamensis]
MIRRALAALVVLPLALAAACSSEPPTPAPSPPAPSAPARFHPATLGACAEAIKVSRSGATAFTGTVDTLKILAVQDMDQKTIDAKTDEAEQALRAAMSTWSRTLSALAAQDVDPRIRAALLDGAHDIDKLNDPNDLTAPAEARTTVERLAGRLEAACAA